MPDFTTATWTLSDIIAKVRQVTGRPDTTELSDQAIVDYINRYYQYTLPKELKTFFGYTYYSFFTEQGVDQYTPPSTFQTLNPKVYVDGFPSNWYLSPDLFYQDYPQQENKLVVATGDGTNDFTFTVSAFPILIGSLYVTDGTQTAQDDGSGGFTGDATGGSIDYTTGTVSNLIFTSTPATGANITATSQTYQGNRPQGLLYFDNVFTLRPVPDDVYLVKMQGIKIPTALVNYTDVPMRTDMGPLIAYGAALQIFTSYEQFEQYDKYMKEYVRFKDISMQDTYEEYMYERSVPKF